MSDFSANLIRNASSADKLARLDLQVDGYRKADSVSADVALAYDFHNRVPPTKAQVVAAIREAFGGKVVLAEDMIVDHGHQGHGVGAILARVTVPQQVAPISQYLANAGDYKRLNAKPSSGGLPGVGTRLVNVITAETWDVIGDDEDNRQLVRVQAENIDDILAARTMSQKVVASSRINISKLTASTASGCLYDIGDIVAYKAAGVAEFREGTVKAISKGANDTVNLTVECCGVTETIPAVYVNRIVHKNPVVGKSPALQDYYAKAYPHSPEFAKRLTGGR